MTTDAPLAIEPILDTLASADHVLPRAALRRATNRWSDISPALLEKLDAVIDGSDRSERTETILSFGIYLMAQAHETRAYRPLCKLAADGDVLSDLIGDGVTEDLTMILTRIYDGDPAPLKALIEDADADEFNRDAALDALAQLTAVAQIDRDETMLYLRELRTTLQPQDTSYVWVGWQRAIANLGFDDLVPLVEDVFDRDWIELVWLGISDFHEDLREALQASEPTAAFYKQTLDDGRLDDVIKYMSDWACFQPGAKRKPTSSISAAAAPIRNPYRGVGRNDPCPCGSGKKFKKCCLETVQ